MSDGFSQHVPVTFTCTDTALWTRGSKSMIELEEDVRGGGGMEGEEPREFFNSVAQTSYQLEGGREGTIGPKI